MTGTQSDPHRRRAIVPTSVVEPRAEPEVFQEDGRMVVSLAHPESDLASLRFETHRWSLRIWKDGEDLLAQHQVVFPSPVDPKSFVLRLENGVLEFLFALDA
jgi:hypothetical protein